MKRLIIGLICFSLVKMWSAGWIYGFIPKEEREALRTLFDENGSNEWKRNSNWNSAPGTEGTWEGVKCENDTTITLKLNGNKLQGELPADLGALSNLITLDLSRNRLTGQIPEFLKRLKHLKKLNLSKNELNGPIPAWLGDLTELEELILDGNRFTGAIPDTLGKLTKLKKLNLSSNGLTGKIPSSLISNLKDKQFNFNWNGLSSKEISDWERTQTIAPISLEATNPTEDSITLSWEKIAYKENTGGYRVYYSTTKGGPYTIEAGETDNKNTNEIVIKNLIANTLYYFVVKAWTSPHEYNKNKIESDFSIEYSAATLGIIISGTVTSQNKPLSAVKIKAITTTTDINGKVEKVFDEKETDGRGNYSLKVLRGWSGLVVAYKEGFDFSQPKKEYKQVNENKINQDFDAIANTIISGKVTYKDQCVDGVKIKYGDTPLGTTKEDGTYEFTVDYNWSGTLTPEKEGHLFDPPQIAYPNVKEKYQNQNYKIKFPVISGKITDRSSKKCINHILLTFTFPNIGKKQYACLKDTSETDNETTYSFKAETDKNGEYKREVPNTWSGDITPTKEHYIFYPESKKNLSADDAQKPVNFKAERDFNVFFMISGSFLLPSESRFADIYRNGTILPSITTGYKINRSIFAWGSYALFSNNGKSALGKPSRWKQSYLSLGGGYYRNLSIRSGLRVSIGGVVVHFSEEAFGDKVTANTIGTELNMGWIYKFNQHLFTEIGMDYLYAADTVEEISINLGGLRAYLSVGFRY